jgi:hypothetical protein
VARAVVPGTYGAKKLRVIGMPWSFETRPKMRNFKTGASG